MSARGAECCRSAGVCTRTRLPLRRPLRRRCLPPVGAALSTEQLTLVAARLSTVRCRELLAATCTELLKAAIVGSAAASSATKAPAADSAGVQGPGSGSSDGGSTTATPEAILELLHEAAQACLQDVAHKVAPAHQEAWSEAHWEAFHAAHDAVNRMLLSLYSQAADGGSAAGALQVARCLEHGLLVPQDAAAAHRQFKRAAQLGSAEACLRCGIHCFEGTAPGGRDGATAFDYFSRALDLAEASIAAASQEGSCGADHSAASGSGPGSVKASGHVLPPLAPQPPEMAVEGDLPDPLSAEEVRFSALTWMGRCYMEGAGVPRSMAEAARCFSAAGNNAELQQLAALKRMFADLETL